MPVLFELLLEVCLFHMLLGAVLFSLLMIFCKAVFVVFLSDPLHIILIPHCFHQLRIKMRFMFLNFWEFFIIYICKFFLEISGSFYKCFKAFILKFFFFSFFYFFKVFSFKVFKGLGYYKRALTGLKICSSGSFRAQLPPVFFDKKIGLFNPKIIKKTEGLWLPDTFDFRSSVQLLSPRQRCVYIALCKMQDHLSKINNPTFLPHDARPTGPRIWPWWVAVSIFQNTCFY